MQMRDLPRTIWRGLRSWKEYVPDLRSPATQKISDAELAQAIAEGKARMFSFKLVATLLLSAPILDVQPTIAAKEGTGESVLLWPAAIL